MKTRPHIVLAFFSGILVSFTLVTPLLAAPPTSPPAAAKLGDLAWMAGHWVKDDGKSRTEELWLEPAGGLMLAVSRTVREGGRTAFEYLRIEENDGRLVYQASPNGAAPTPFTLVELGGQKAVFENLEHDFPQRIVYWRTEAGLCARIEGEDRGKTRGFEWCWQRAATTP